MSSLIISDVFEAYYEGRKGIAGKEGGTPAKPGKREEKLRPEAANKEDHVPRAA